MDIAQNAAVSMDKSGIVEALRATTSSADQAAAAAYLEKAAELVGYAPMLIHFLMDEQLDPAARQASVLYLKNFLNRYWDETEDECEQVKIRIAEQDKQVVREHIIDCIVGSPEAIRVQLCTGVQSIMRADFPDKWPQVIDKIQALLETTDAPSWLGALLVTHRLTKLYEYRRQKEKAPLIAAMHRLLPMIFQRMIAIMDNMTQEACLLQKLVLKIFYCLVQYSLNTELMSLESFSHWVEVFRRIIERPIPEEVDQLDDAEKTETVWWKRKKWALKILNKIFDKYGSPGQVEPMYAQFAETYLEHHAIPTVHTVLTLLHEKTTGKFVSEQVIYHALTYLAAAVSHAKTWKEIKPYITEMTAHLIFPLMRHDDDDEELWEDNPEEFIRFKYDIFEDLHNPESAAANFLQNAAKRKDILPTILQYIINVLSTSTDARDIDGALHIVGELAQALVKHRTYKKDVEKLLEAHVLPRIEHEARFVRARACWCVKACADASFTNPHNKTSILKRLTAAIVRRLVEPNEELPVKVEAALAIQYIMIGQEEKARECLLPYIREVVMEVLRLVSKTEVEELTGVMDKLIEDYMEDVIPIAHEVAIELVNIFNRLTTVEEGEAMEDHTITVMGILNTLDNILSLVEDHPQIMAHVEETIRGVIERILVCHSCDYYEEAVSLIQSLIATQVSPPMWGIFEKLGQCYMEDGSAFFCDVVPVLHQYLAVGYQGLLENPQRLQLMLEMIRMALHDMDAGDEVHLYAAKMLECLIIQCHPHVDEIVPTILQWAFERFHKECGSVSGLRPMLIVVFISSFYCNKELTAQVLFNLLGQPAGNPLDWLYNQILTLYKDFEGVHDRKLALFALTAALQLPAELRPTPIAQNPNEVTKKIMHLFDSLQKAIKAIADMNVDSDEDDSETESDASGDGRRHIDQDLGDSEDEIDEGTLEYLEQLAKSGRNGDKSFKTYYGEGDDEDSSDDDDFDGRFIEETEVEAYTNKLDEDDSGFNVFVSFKTVFEGLQTADPNLFAQMTTGLDESEMNDLKKLITVCAQNEQAEQSRQVAQAGGYAFNSDAGVPSNFNFGDVSKVHAC
ncbi:hypothetical protein L596_014319 [Steinernema carpocapsae]|uniref:Importin N-terminal domain-containing protein n=1 Tax=Steinernema carpocapsae TaxID=34508 RepID=A0A4U5NBK4_STECR|nr:hypothetical protein L596_014319 [Steinernema carpocapsae]